MKALILAAGLGSRLGDMTKETSKAMVKVYEDHLIEHILKFVSQPRIDKIGIVGGYHFDLLKEHTKGRDVELFYNKDFREGNILTLKAGLNFLDDSFLLCNVDHIYPKKMLGHILDTSKGITAICDFDRTLIEDDMKVKLSPEKKIKKISKTLTDYDCGYIGMTYCDKSMVATYKQAVNDTIDIYGRQSCVEHVLGHLAANDTEINICDASGFGWLEVDTQEDLKCAEEKLMGDKK